MLLVSQTHANCQSVDASHAILALEVQGGMAKVDPLQAREEECNPQLRPAPQTSLIIMTIKERDYS